MADPSNPNLQFSPGSSFLDDAIFAAFEYDPLPEPAVVRGPVAAPAGISHSYYPVKPGSAAPVSVSSSSSSSSVSVSVSV